MRITAPSSGCFGALLACSALPAFALPAAGKVGKVVPELFAAGHGAVIFEQSEADLEPALSHAGRNGIDFVPAPVFMLGPIDEAGLLLEDDADQSHGRLRFSIQRPIDLTMADGQWMPVEGGHIWRIQIEGLGSLNNRLHLTGLDLGEGQEIHMDSPQDPQSLTGAITGVGEYGNGEAWGIFAPGSVARLEWFVPQGTVPTALPFAGIEYAHGYRDIFNVLPREGGDKASGCVVDPACYPDWANVSNAAGQMSFTSEGFSYVCSGQLIATTAADETPYFSTANHCISTQSEANSLVVRFFYRANTCNGSISPGSSVSGADLMANYAFSDSTLLMLRGALPSGVFWVGWQNTNPANGTASASIHHPAGVEQDIGFCSKTGLVRVCTTGSGSNSGSRVTFSIGNTEGGSSGSGLYVVSTQRLYGVLSCGCSSCSAPTCPDEYGRWDLAVNNAGFGTLLAAGSDDTQEDNDTCATAKVLTAGTYTGLIVKRVDEDWYAFDLAQGATLSLSSTYTHANGNVNFQLFGNCGDATPLTSNTNSVNNATLSYVNSGAARRVYLRVYLATDTRNEYTLSATINVPPPVNNECALATAVSEGSYNFNTAFATNSAVTIPSSCNAGGGTAINKDIWYLYVATQTGTATVSTCGTAGFDTNVVVYGSTCPTASTPVLACSDNAADCTGGTSSASWEVVEGGEYRVRLGSPGTGSGTGTISFSSEPAVSPCPSDLDANNVVDAGDIGIMLLEFGTCGASCPADLDANGMVDAGDIGLLLLSYGDCP